MEVYHKLLVKRQSTSGSVCKLVFEGLQPTGQLLCCENNRPCLAKSPVCSSTNKMIQCWFITNLDACKRKDALAKTVCQYLDGVYCLKGETDQPYDSSKLGDWNVISVMLSRNTGASSVNGYTSNYTTPPLPVSPPLLAARAPQLPPTPGPPPGPPPGPSPAPDEPKSIVCSDSMASGICQIKYVSGYKPFSYDVEVCNNSIDIINSLPQISNATTTVSTTVSITSTILSPPTTVTASPLSNTVKSLSNHLETGSLSSLLLVILLIISTGNIIGRGKFGILCII